MRCVGKLCTSVRGRGGGGTTHSKESQHLEASSSSSKRKMLKHSQACLSCSRSKVRCDGNRPCSKCVTRGTADQCVDQKKGFSGRRASVSSLSSRRASVSFLSIRRASVTSLSNSFPPTELTDADAQQHAFSPTALGSAGAAGVAGDMNPESPSLQGVRHDSSVDRDTLDVSHATRDLADISRLSDMRGMSPLCDRHKDTDTDTNKRQTQTQTNGERDCSTIAVVDRPLSFRANSVSRDVTRLQLQDVVGSCDIDGVPGLLKILWENQGVSAHHAVDVFLAMPPRLQQVLRVGLTAMEIFLHNMDQIGHRRSFGGGSSCCISAVGAMRKRFEEEDESCSGGVGGSRSGGGTPTDDEDDELSAANGWHISMRCGFQIIETHAATNRWHTCGVNGFLSTFAGMHQEEFLARMGNNDMGLASTELRQLCAHSGALFLAFKIYQSILSNASASGGGPEVSTDRQCHFYSRWTKNYGRGEEGSDGSGELMRSTFTLKADKKTGMISKVIRSCVIISEDEYDRTRVSDSHSCELLAAMAVGSKSGKELRSKELLEEESFAHLASSQKGLNQLDVLASILEEQFLPIVRETNLLSDASSPGYLAN